MDILHFYTCDVGVHRAEMTVSPRCARGLTEDRNKEYRLLFHKTPSLMVKYQNHLLSHDVQLICLLKKDRKQICDTISEDDDMSKEWFPMIDYDKCIGCGKCTDMCKHVVYRRHLLTKKPKIVNTLGCVHGCHGCGKKCPTTAIRYHGDGDLL